MFITDDLSHFGYLQTSRVESQTYHISLMAQKNEDCHQLQQNHVFNRSYLLFLGNSPFKKYNMTELYFYPLKLSNCFFFYSPLLFFLWFLGHSNLLLSLATQTTTQFCKPIFKTMEIKKLKIACDDNNSNHNNNNNNNNDNNNG